MVLLTMSHGIPLSGHPMCGRAWLVAILLGCLSGGPVRAQVDPSAPPADAVPATSVPDPLPEGADGIAGRYPRDSGIGADPQVLIADDFESHTTIAHLKSTWDTVHHEAHMALVDDSAPSSGGRKALEFTLPQQVGEFSHALASGLTPERDVVFLRYYAVIDPPFDVVGSSHNGGTISGKYFVDGRATPGIPADGRNKFLAALECWRGEPITPSPGHLNVYLYHPEQRSQWGDHFFPSGKVIPNSSQPFNFGPGFVPRQDVVPALGQWHCYEFMVALNTPGQRNGRIACWLDGRLTSDFPNLRLRDIAELKIDRIGLNFHAGSNPIGPASQRIDHVVAATAYIGPMAVPD